MPSTRELRCTKRDHEKPSIPSIQYQVFVGTRLPNELEINFLRSAMPATSARIMRESRNSAAASIKLFSKAPTQFGTAIIRGGNGLLTIARGAVPLAIFGPHGCGERTGLLGAPARAAQAFAPLLFGLLMDRMGLSVLFVSASLCIAALGALNVCARGAR